MPDGKEDGCCSNDGRREVGHPVTEESLQQQRLHPSLGRLHTELRPVFADFLQDVLQQVSGRHSRGVPLELVQHVHLPLLNYKYRQSKVFLTTTLVQYSMNVTQLIFQRISTDVMLASDDTICSGRIKNH